MDGKRRNMDRNAEGVMVTSNSNGAVALITKEDKSDSNFPIKGKAGNMGINKYKVSPPGNQMQSQPGEDEVVAVLNTSNQRVTVEEKVINPNGSKSGGIGVNGGLGQAQPSVNLNYASPVCPIQMQVDTSQATLVPLSGLVKQSPSTHQTSKLRTSTVLSLTALSASPKFKEIEYPANTVDKPNTILHPLSDTPCNSAMESLYTTPAQSHISATPLFGDQFKICNSAEVYPVVNPKIGAQISILQRVKNRGTTPDIGNQFLSNIRGIEQPSTKPETKLDKKKKAKKMAQILPLEGVLVGKVSKPVGSYNTAAVKKGASFFCGCYFRTKN
ncbi:hypothetical protein LINGRAHAP2_LOCUS23193 [Linum grandiflorum]